MLPHCQQNFSPPESWEDCRSHGFSNRFSSLHQEFISKNHQAKTSTRVSNLEVLRTIKCSESREAVSFDFASNAQSSKNPDKLACEFCYITSSSRFILPNSIRLKKFTRLFDLACVRIELMTLALLAPRSAN